MHQGHIGQIQGSTHFLCSLLLLCFRVRHCCCVSQEQESLTVKQTRDDWPRWRLVHVVLMQYRGCGMLPAGNTRNQERDARAATHRLQQRGNDVFEVGREEAGAVRVLKPGRELRERVAHLRQAIMPCSY